jgi:hypothetical protein
MRPLQEARPARLARRTPATADESPRCAVAIAHEAGFGSMSKAGLLVPARAAALPQAPAAAWCGLARGERPPVARARGPDASMTVGFVRSNPAAMRNPTRTYAPTAGAPAPAVGASRRRPVTVQSAQRVLIQMQRDRWRGFRVEHARCRRPAVEHREDRDRVSLSPSRGMQHEVADRHQRGTVVGVVLLPHRRHVIHALVKVSSQLLVAEGREVDRRQVAMLRDRARLRLFVPMPQGVAPDPLANAASANPVRRSPPSPGSLGPSGPKRRTHRLRGGNPLTNASRTCREHGARRGEARRVPRYSPAATESPRACPSCIHGPALVPMCRRSSRPLRPHGGPRRPHCTAMMHYGSLVPRPSRP